MTRQFFGWLHRYDNSLASVRCEIYLKNVIEKLMSQISSLADCKIANVKSILGFASINTAQSMTCVNDWIHNGLQVVCVCLHVILPHYADLAENIEHISRFVGYVLYNVCLRLVPSSQSFFMQYVGFIRPIRWNIFCDIYGLCVFALYFSPLLIVKICLLHLIPSSNRKYESLAFIMGQAMKQLYALHILPWPYWFK